MVIKDIFEIITIDSFSKIYINNILVSNIKPYLNKEFVYATCDLEQVPFTCANTFRILLILKIYTKGEETNVGSN